MTPTTPRWNGLVASLAATCVAGSVWAQAPARTPRAARHPLRSGVQAVVVEDHPTAPGTRADTAAAPEAPAPSVLPEVVKDLHPNGRLKSQRQVVRDAQGHALNHGPWIVYDAEGQVLGTGQYEQGRRVGPWTRRFPLGDGAMFDGPLFSQFTPPFKAQATFANDELDGTWTIRDTRGRAMARWEFSAGQRQGKHLWWYPDGQQRREAVYQDDQLKGPFREWNAAGQLETDVRYLGGRRIEVVTEWYAPEKRRSEGEFLMPREVTQTHFDFWAGVAEEEILASSGQPERHGRYLGFHPTGAPHIEGTYDHDRPVGEFTWWYPSGQVQVTGRYELGQEDGDWTWHHANGQRQMSGRYVAGRQVGAWTWWNDRGKVARTQQFGDSAAPLVARDEPTPVAPRHVRRAVRPEPSPRAPIYQAARPTDENLL